MKQLSVKKPSMKQWLSEIKELIGSKRIRKGQKKPTHLQTRYVVIVVVAVINTRRHLRMISGFARPIIQRVKHFVANQDEYQKKVFMKH
jgi:hypothetical protein